MTKQRGGYIRHPAVAITVLLALLMGIVYAFVTLGLSTFPNDPIWVECRV